MAEAILSDLAKKLLEGLGSLLLQEIGIASGVKNELRKLQESLSTINAILLDAEKKGTGMNAVVKGWLRKLKDVAYDAEDVLDEFVTEALRQKVELPKNKVAKQVRRCFSRSNPLVFRLKMGHRIKDLIERLDCIQKNNEIAQFQFKTQNVDLNVDAEDDYRRDTDPYVIESEVLGREKDKEYLIDKLLIESSGGDENVLVIPIIGIGGLGKTTLAQYVYNDERVKKHFDLRMWVCVSFDFDVVKLAKKILECGDLEENQAKSRLVEKLSGKRYLLVLDDVWNDHPGEWDNLRILLMVGAMKGSMILVTTRSEEVASIMHPIKVFYHLEGLDENDCESLFNERAFGGRKAGKEVANRYPELVEIGKGIVKKCGGVPLAAKALGSLLRLKRNINDWLNVLNTEIWNLAGEQEILPALRISYNQLPSHLKQCFAYCSLFPQDHLIRVDGLIRQWMAHGFISSSSSSGGSHNESLEDIGNGYFRELLWRSFFQEVEEVKCDNGNIRTCKMHDLVHNLARWVAGLEWSEVVLHSSPSSRTSCSSGVRHMIQFYDGKADTHPLPLLEKPQKLRTFYLQCSDYTSMLAISAGSIISSLRGLRVLDLSRLGMKDVPSSIGYLEQLRYLDLSENYFEALPNSICRLYNLQTLRLDNCSHFYEWPTDMTKMVSLRHLWFNMINPLNYMPRGLGQLTSLRTLGTFVVDDPNNTRRRTRIGGRLGELHGLNQLGGSLSIKGLGNVRDARDAEEAKLKEKSQLQDLEFHFGSSITNRQGRLEDEQVLGNLEPHPSLKGLGIEWYQGVKMPRWMIIPSSSLLLSNLVLLKIKDCSNLICFPLIGEFPCLRTLFLCNLNALESICNKVIVGEGEALPLFPSLEDLTLKRLPNLKRWTINPSSSVEATRTMTTVEEEQEDEAQHNTNQFDILSSLLLSNLVVLKIEGCSNLKCLPLIGEFPCLRTLSLRFLNALESICNKVVVVGGEALPLFPSLEDLTLYQLPNLKRWTINPSSSVEATTTMTTVEEEEEEEEEVEAQDNNNQFDFLPSMFPRLTHLSLEECPKLTRVPLLSVAGIQHLTFLESLSINGLERLESLPDCPAPATLQRLMIDNCPSLVRLPDRFFENLKLLSEFQISNCSEQTQSIEQCNSLNQLPESLGNLTALQQLSISGLKDVNQLPESLGNLTALQQLSISGLKGVNQLPESLGNLTALQQLHINDFTHLASLPKGIQHFTALKELRIKSCPGLKALPEGLGSLSSLVKLYIKDCSNLSSLPKGLHHLTALEYMRIKNCPGLRALPDGLGNLVSRGLLRISDCPNLSLPRDLQRLLS